MTYWAGGSFDLTGAWSGPSGRGRPWFTTGEDGQPVPTSLAVVRAFGEKSTTTRDGRIIFPHPFGGGGLGWVFPSTGVERVSWAGYRLDPEYTTSFIGPLRTRGDYVYAYAVMAPVGGGPSTYEIFRWSTSNYGEPTTELQAFADPSLFLLRADSVRLPNPISHEDSVLRPMFAALGIQVLPDGRTFRAIYADESDGTKFGVVTVKWSGAYSVDFVASVPMHSGTIARPYHVFPGTGRTLVLVSTRYASGEWPTFIRKYSRAGSLLSEVVVPQHVFVDSLSMHGGQIWMGVSYSNSRTLGFVRVDVDQGNVEHISVEAVHEYINSTWPGWPTPGTTFSVSWSRNGEWLALAGSHRIVTTSTKRVEWSWPVTNFETRSVDWSPAEDRYAISDRPWFVVSAAARVKESGWPTESQLGVFKVDFVNWSPDGSRLALAVTTGTGQRYIRVLNVATKSAESGWPVTTHSAEIVGNVAWSPDGTKLAYFVTVSPWLIVIDAVNKTVESGWPVPTSWGHSVRWSPDGSRLLITGRTSIYRVINVATKTFETGWPSPSVGTVNVAAWNRDGTRLIAGGSSSPYYRIINTATKTIESGWPALAVSSGSLSVWDAEASPSGAKIALGVIASLGTPGYILDVGTKTLEPYGPSLFNVSAPPAPYEPLGRGVLDGGDSGVKSVFDVPQGSRQQMNLGPLR